MLNTLLLDAVNVASSLHYTFFFVSNFTIVFITLICCPLAKRVKSFDLKLLSFWCTIWQWTETRFYSIFCSVLLECIQLVGNFYLRWHCREKSFQFCKCLIENRMLSRQEYATCKEFPNWFPKCSQMRRWLVHLFHCLHLMLINRRCSDWWWTC